MMALRKLDPLELLPVVIGNMSIAVSFFVIGQVFNIWIFNIASEVMFIAVTVVYAISILIITLKYFMRNR